MESREILSGAKDQKNRRAELYEKKYKAGPS